MPFSVSVVSPLIASTSSYERLRVTHSDETASAQVWPTKEQFLQIFFPFFQNSLYRVPRDSSQIDKLLSCSAPVFLHQLVDFLDFLPLLKLYVCPERGWSSFDISTFLKWENRAYLHLCFLHIAIIVRWLKHFRSFYRWFFQQNSISGPRSLPFGKTTKASEALRKKVTAWFNDSIQQRQSADCGWG